MIKIGGISNDGFPIVDFKFQNRGHATAFLHKFTVHVLSARIDFTPVLAHYMEISYDSKKPPLLSPEGSLTLTTNNLGWGDAHNCEIEFANGTLAELFNPEIFQFKGMIPSGAKLPTITLDPKGMDINWFQGLQDRARRIAKKAKSNYNSNFDKEFMGAIQIHEPFVNARFKDKFGKAYQNQVMPYFGRLFRDFEGELFLNLTEFIWRPPKGDAYADYGPNSPSSQYFISIDPERGTTDKIYSISHTIRSGQVERFQLALGAAKSCFVRLKFTFIVDHDQCLQSDEFEVHIFAPQNSPSHIGYNRYEDGDELLSRLLERKAKPHFNKKNKRQSKNTVGSSKFLKFLKSGFPFFKQNNDDID